MAWYLGDLNTRARGLRTHLLTASDLDRLARVTSLSALQRELNTLGYARADAPASAAILEKAVRLHAAKKMAVLDRWCGVERRAAFAALFEDEDRRSIQTILRGAEQGTASEVRMAGLIPTTSLSESALQTLANQPTLADVIRMLILWNHPLGIRLVGAASGPHPSLFDAEVELQRAFARRAASNARRVGPQMVEYVEQVIDVMNVWSALLHFTERDPRIVDLSFVEGGRWLTRRTFRQLMDIDSLPGVEKRLSWEFRKSPLATVFREDIADLAELEGSVLRAQIDWQNRSLRVDPSGASAVIGFALELRAEVLDLRRIIWGVSLRAPAALIQADMVVV